MILVTVKQKLSSIAIKTEKILQNYLSTKKKIKINKQIDKQKI